MGRKKQDSDPQDQQQQQILSNDDEPSRNAKKPDDNTNCDNSAKTIPVAKLPQKLTTNKIIINISDTQYPVIQEVAEELGWVVQKAEGSGDWDVWWTDRQIYPDILYRMNLHQKINHFPGICNLARKNLLALNLSAMQQKYPNQYDFFPETWTIPLQFPQFRHHYEKKMNAEAPETYIVKPEALSQGRGIFLTRNIQQVLNGSKYVIQKYIDTPLLIEGLKFDLRIYVLLKSVYPLQIYIFDEGLVRLATQRYQKVSESNIHKVFMHLTNYSLNKNNPLYQKNAVVQALRDYFRRQDGQPIQKKQEATKQSDNTQQSNINIDCDNSKNISSDSTVTQCNPQSNLKQKIQSEEDDMESLDQQQLQMIQTGHKRSLSSLWQHLSKEQNLSQTQIQLLQKSIDDLIIKTIIAGYPAILHQYKYCQPELPEDTNMCFHILGIDVMLAYDNHQKIMPILLEINHTPSFQTSSDLDYKIKKNLIVDALKIMEITQKNKKKLFKKGKQINRKRLQTGKREAIQVKHNADKGNKVAESSQPNKNPISLGGFRKVYPVIAVCQTDQNCVEQIRHLQKKYHRLIEYANVVHKQTSEVRNKLIKEEQDKLKHKKREEKLQSKDSKNKNTQQQSVSRRPEKEQSEGKQRKNSQILQCKTDHQKTANFRTKTTKKTVTVYSQKQQKNQPDNQKIIPQTSVILKKQQKEKVAQSKCSININTVENSLYELYQGDLVITQQDLDHKNLSSFANTNSQKHKKSTSTLITTRKEQLLRFSQVMMKLVVKQQYHQHKNEVHNQEFRKVLKQKKAFTSKSNHNNNNQSNAGYSNLYQPFANGANNIPKISQVIKTGSFVTPKTYEIVDGRNKKEMDSQVSNVNANSNMVSTCNTNASNNVHIKVRQFNELLSSIDGFNKTKIDPKIIKNLQREAAISIAYKKKKRYSVI